MRRLSAMTSRSLYLAPGLVTPKFAQLAVDLGVHVEGLLALAQTALVAGHDELANLLKFVANKGITPEIGLELPMEKATDGFRAMLDGDTAGKIVFTR